MIEITEKKLKDYQFIDLFCGIGGFHLALKSFGAKCVFASEIDKNACEVYKNNFEIIPNGDITSIPINKIPPHNILCAGFPCQPFSISGKKNGFKEKGKGDLFYNVVKIANVHKPEIIILENVRNFKNHDNGRTLDRVYKSLRGIGYTVFDEVLCASDFRVPQARKRIYIVAFKNDLNIGQFDFPKPIEAYITLQDILIQDRDNDIPGNYFVVRDDIIINEQDSIKSKRLKRVGSKGLGRQGERIYSIYGQATTLSAQGGGIGGKTGMYVVNNQVRKLYPRECASLMGFPKNFKLADTQNKNYTQFGNSVVVDVLQYIILKLIETLKV